MTASELLPTFQLGIQTVRPKGRIEFATSWFNTGIPDEVVLAIVEAYLRRSKREYQDRFDHQAK